MSTKESSAGSASSARIIVKDRSQEEEVTSVAGRWLRFDATLREEYGLSATRHKKARVCQRDAGARFVRQIVARPVLASSSLRPTRALHAGNAIKRCKRPLAKPAIRRCRVRVDG